ncbi:WXG100 family type VII secretion target [Streptomyces anthocyanicus]|uniref:WXG100 family type VII secretion target n=1 Tax=Streptomyces violaceolatus TaxID=67378 RepID=A0ABN3TBR2_9ACTN|nr:MULTISPECIES: WXG100 family type VII secretion target [Streptomyces]MDX3349469.1 WXG100 family type VII secretion target [Streptomyces sp. ME02-6979A]
MALPGNWDSATIAVNPWVLHSSAKAVVKSLEDVLTELNTIMTVLGELKLSWTGDSATLADQYNERWNKAMKELYGTKEDPSTGILNVLASGLGSAAVNYSRGERSVSDMFVRFEASLQGVSLDGLPPDADLEEELEDAKRPEPTPSDPTKAPPEVDVTDVVTDGNWHTTSVNEKF